MEPEEEGDKNLISFRYIIYASVIFVLDFFVFFVYKQFGNPDVPVAMCSYNVFACTVMGLFANRPNLRDYFCHYMKQIYHSNSLAQYLARLSTRGAVLPIND